MIDFDLIAHADDLASTIALAIVCIACVMHLASNVTAASPECERWGFTLTGAGAFGVAVYMWWPTIEGFPFPLLMHIGMALIALSIIRGRVREWLISHGAKALDRRRQVDLGEATGAFVARFDRRD